MFRVKVTYVDRASAMYEIALCFMVAAALLPASAQENFRGLNRPNDMRGEPFNLEMYDEERSVPGRYRYAMQDMDQNDIGFIAPDEEYISGELDYGNNKSPDLMMEQVYPGDYVAKNRNKTFKKVLLKMLDDNDIDFPNEGVKKRVLSSFRERMENEKSKNQIERLDEQFLKKLENDEGRYAEMEYDANKEYIDALRELWNKYKNSEGTFQDDDSRVYMPEVMRKRQMMSEYPALGYSAVGYRKRESPANYAFANEALYHNNNDMLRARRYELSETPMYNQEYTYKRKRNAVTKRSSNFYNNHHKRFAKDQYRKKVNKKEHSGTDPKIVKDLKSIFGTTNNKTEHIEKKKSVKKSIESSTPAITTEHTLKRTETPAPTNHKTHEEHLNIKKKSLDWSNYFGYDRRKKSRNDIDNEWLMERYHKALNSATKKSMEYPLKYFRNHDDKRQNDDGEIVKKEDMQNTNEAKLGEMDLKLKNIEDLIIDEALKYTGAHEGTTDSKEIQEIKDKVISRLAAAYSLEKMRKALGEFKNSIASERYPMKYNEVPDKEAESEPEKEEKKKDKFREEKKDVSDRTENELDSEEGMSNSLSGITEYEILERRCRSVAQSITAGEQGDFYYPLCKWHQMCYACDTDDSPDSLTNCDLMFLSKAYVLCQGDLVCQWAARPAVEYLRDSYESDPPLAYSKGMCHNEPPYNSEYHFKSR